MNPKKDFPDQTARYTSITMPTVLEIHSIYSIHYFEYARNFSFAGERHNFWELIFVDKGNVFITADSREILLHKDEVAFHQPMEFHAVHARNFAPNLIVISFRCASPAMDFFRNRILRVNEEDRALLASIVSRARASLSCRIDDPFLTKLSFRTGVHPETQQLIALDLTSFLLHLMLRAKNDVVSRSAVSPQADLASTAGRVSKTTTLNNRHQLFVRLEQYLTEHLTEPLKIPQICRDNLISRSLLCSIYKKETGQGVMEHFHQLKIEQARTLIRSTDLSMTQISDHLGYTTLQYFSRQFRAITGMSPSEYATSVKALAEHRETMIEAESSPQSFGAES